MARSFCLLRGLNFTQVFAYMQKKLYLCAKFCNYDRDRRKMDHGDQTKR